MDPDRTLTLVPSSARSATPDRASGTPRKSGQHSLWGYVVAAAVGALLVAFGILIGGLVRGMEPWLQHGSSQAIPVHSRATHVRAPRDAVGIPVGSGAVSSGAPAFGRSSEATSIISAGDEGPETSSAESSADRSVAKPSSVATSRSARLRAPIAQRDEKLVASRAGTLEPAPGSTRYCGQVGETVFRQRPPTGAADPEDLAAQAPRADSGLMRILFTVSAPPTFAAVSFENGGDTSVHLQRLEESTSSHGFRMVRAALPASVSAGGVKELFRYPVEPGEGEMYERRFVAVDRRGDSWTAALELVPCRN